MGLIPLGDKSTIGYLDKESRGQAFKATCPLPARPTPRPSSSPWGSRFAGDLRTEKIDPPGAWASRIRTPARGGRLVDK